MTDWSLRQKLRESIIAAVNQGDHVEVKALLQQGADINEGEGGYTSKQTLLMMAIERGHVNVGKALVEAGADLTATLMVNQRETTALDIAKEKELSALVELIDKKIKVNQRLLSSVQEGNSAQMNESLNDGANVNLLHQEGDTPPTNLLFLALTRGQMDVAKILIQGGINLQITAYLPDTSTDDTARSYAQRLRHHDIVSLIDTEIQRRNQTNNMNIPTVLAEQPNEKQQQPQQQQQQQPQQPQQQQQQSPSLMLTIEDIEDDDLEDDPVSSDGVQAQRKRNWTGSCRIL